VAWRHHNDLVLSGHDHDYERFRPMDGSGHVQPARGMQEFVVGTGGRSLYHLGTRKHGSVFYQARHFGVLLLTLRPGSYSWGYRTIDGTTPDSGSRSCV
jgi:predicted flavoprotein YhiN